MAKTARMAQIEALLASDPADAFLRYGLAMEYASAGDDATAARLLTELVTSDPGNPYVPAFLMAGQIYQRLGDDAAAVATLKAGVAAAAKAGNDHARGEMEGLLATLE
jgi:predicted Zn-dependent protease